MTDRPGSFEIPESLAGERLDRALSLLTGWPRSKAASVIADAAVLVDGAPAPSGSVRVVAGSTVAVTHAQGRAEAPEQPRPTVPPDVLYADADIVVVNKPPGVVTHRGSGHPSGTLADALVERYPEIADVGQPDRPGIVHRLDRGTSGVLVCARSAQAYDGLVGQLSARQVRRTYAALARGRPASPTGTIDAPIGRDPAQRTLMAVTAGGREARTHYRTVAAFARPVEASLLHCELETGRTHQIRVHLASIGLPLLGDSAYGVADPFGIGRPLLHAIRLRLRHPASGADMSFAAPMPDDLAGALAQVGFDPSDFPSE